MFSNELASSPRGFEPGQLVELQDLRGRFLAVGYVNPHSLISARVLSRQREDIGKEFFLRRIVQAQALRAALPLERGSYRLIYSEADMLPGLVVDIYQEVVVAQLNTAGMEALKPLVLEALQEALRPKALVLRADSRARTLEGLPLYAEVAAGTLEGPVEITEGGLRLLVEPLRGQKTGFFLDQRFNRLALGRFLPLGGRGMDLFTYTGAWALQAAHQGAEEVLAVDTSGTALELARDNAALNGLSQKVRFEQADALEALQAEAPESLDFIVADPPSLIRSAAHLKEGQRLYRRLNALCMSRLKRGGLLATSSCSWHMHRELFLQSLHEAAREAGRTTRLLWQGGQGPDHPVLLAMPETEYLKCFFLRVD